LAAGIAVRQWSDEDAVDSGSTAAGPPVIAMGADDDRLYVALGNRLTVYRSTGDLRTSFLVPGPARALAVTPDGNRVFLAAEHSGSGRVFGYEPDANLFLGQDPDGPDPGGAVVGDRPAAVALNLDASRLYVANSGSGTVSVVATDTMTLIDTIQVGGDPLGLTVSASGRLYVALGYDSDEVAVYDLATETLRSPITVGSGPYGVAATPDGARVYVTNFRDSTVSVIGTATDTVIDDTSNLGEGPYAVAVRPDGSYTVVANVHSGTLSAIGADIRESVGDWLGVVGQDPVHLVFNRDGTRLYVAHDGGVAVVDTLNRTVLPSAVTLPT
jgi:YVTN family beta-propeller protein